MYRTVRLNKKNKNILIFWEPFFEFWYLMRD